MDKPLAEITLDSSPIRKGGAKCELPLFFIEEQLKQLEVMLGSEKIVQVNVYQDKLEFVMESVDNV